MSCLPAPSLIIVPRDNNHHTAIIQVAYVLIAIDTCYQKTLSSLTLANTHNMHVGVIKTRIIKKKQ